MYGANVRQISAAPLRAGTLRATIQQLRRLLAVLRIVCVRQTVWPPITHADGCPNVRACRAVTRLRTPKQRSGRKESRGQRSCEQLVHPRVVLPPRVHSCQWGVVSSCAFLYLSIPLSLSFSLSRPTLKGMHGEARLTVTQRFRSLPFPLLHIPSARYRRVGCHFTIPLGRGVIIPGLRHRQQGRPWWGRQLLPCVLWRSRRHLNFTSGSCWQHNRSCG